MSPEYDSLYSWIQLITPEKSVLNQYANIYEIFGDVNRKIHKTEHFMDTVLVRVIGIVIFFTNINLGGD